MLLPSAGSTSLPLCHCLHPPESLENQIILSTSLRKICLSKCWREMASRNLNCITVGDVLVQETHPSAEAELL